MARLVRMNKILEKLPKLDCGNCGAPTCRAFAEDFVRGIKRNCRYVKEDRYED